MKQAPESETNQAPVIPPAGEKKAFPIIPLVAVVVVAGGTFFYVSALRAKAADAVVKMTHELAVPPVQVVSATVSQAAGELLLPGNVTPYADTPIFARTDGYVKRWLVDLGASVKQGDLLVELEAPELDQQIRQATSLVAQAEAKAGLAASSDKRWRGLLAQRAVSQQEVDEKAGDLATSQADQQAEEANLARLQQLKAFQRITAPFDGRITARNVETGDRITTAGGTSAERPELYRITQDNILRIYVNVPETHAARIREGQTASVSLASLQGVEVEGKVVRTSGAIDEQSRTMLTEVQVDNHDHKYLAGGYATVRFPLPSSANPTVLPVNTLLYRPEGTVVGVVTKGDGKESVQLRKLKLGRDLGTQVEIIGGLEMTEQVILNPSDSLQEGDLVRVVEKNEG